MNYGHTSIRNLISNLRDHNRSFLNIDNIKAADALEQMLESLFRADEVMVTKSQEIRDLRQKVTDLEGRIEKLSVEADHYMRSLYSEKEEADMLRRDVVTLREQNQDIQDDRNWCLNAYTSVCEELAERNRLVASLRADLDGTARHAASLENQLKEQQNPKVETKGFYAMVQWRGDEQDDVDPIEVFIAQTSDPHEIDQQFVFFYAGDYPEAEIRRMYNRENSNEEWYITS